FFYYILFCSNRILRAGTVSVPYSSAACHAVPHGREYCSHTVGNRVPNGWEDRPQRLERKHRDALV
ncbi:MAG: hypothetical protein ACFNWT_07810, partial [Prevotella denticola]